MLAPDVSVVIGAQDREGAVGTPPKDQQTAVMGSNHHPDHSPEIAPEFSSGDVAAGNTGSISNDEWEAQPTSSGSVFFRHKVTGESRWVADHVTGAANISNAAADLPQDLPQKMIPKEFGSFSPLSPTAIKEVCVFVLTAPLCSIRVDCVHFQSCCFDPLISQDV